MLIHDPQHHNTVEPHYYQLHLQKEPVQLAGFLSLLVLGLLLLEILPLEGRLLGLNRLTYKKTSHEQQEWQNKQKFAYLW